jgi:hypothetical protein
LNREYTVEIEKEFICFDPYELEQWRLGKSEVVPQYAQNWKGNGRANGYGYGEFVAKRHLEITDAEVIANDFNLFSLKSKYNENNKRIEKVMGEGKYKKLQEVLNKLYRDGIKVENPDLCILKPNLFFAEAKKGRDRLREQQIIFAIVIWELFRIPFKIYRLEPQGKTYESTTIIGKAFLSDEYF